MELSNLIEAILFWKGEPITLKRLSDITKNEINEIEKALNTLEINLTSRGIVLMRKDNEVMLGTNKEYGPIIESLIKEDLHRDLGRAGLETLSVVLYLGPVARSEIDYIRGVNSSFIMRNLLVRGLIERVDNPNDKRSYVYKPTFELLSFLGITKVSDLPEYQSFRQELVDRKSKKEVLDQVIKASENTLIQE